MYKTGHSNAAVDAIGAALNFMASAAPAAAVARSQCASFTPAAAPTSYSGTAGVNELAAALGISSPGLEQELASASQIGSAGDVAGEALKTWAAALDARLAPLVYLIGNKLSAIDIAVAVQIKLRLFPSGPADKSVAACITPSHVRFFNHIYAIVGRASGSAVFASELKHPGGAKSTVPVWPDAAHAASASVVKADSSVAAAAIAPASSEKKEKAVASAASGGAAAPPAGEKKEKPAKAEKPKEPEPPKSKGNDASSLDIRVGAVCTCSNHPEADKLCAEPIFVSPRLSLTHRTGSCSQSIRAMHSRALCCQVCVVFLNLRHSPEGAV